MTQWAIPVIVVVICCLAVAALLLTPSPEEPTASGAVDAEPSLDPREVVIAQARMILGDPLAVLVNGSLSEPADSGQRDVQFMRSSVALAAFRLVAEQNGEGPAKNWLISANGAADEAPVDLLYQGRYSDVMAAAETLVLSQ